MNENNEKLWNEALDGIDPRFTDSAAESLMRAESGADGRAVELTVPHKKRSRLPAIAGVCAAAAAAVAVVVGVRFAGKNGILTASTQIVNTDFSEYSADYTLFNKYFAGVWKNSAETDGSPYLVLNEASGLGSVYNDVLFFEEGSECSMAVTTAGGSDIYLKSGGRLYRYEYTGGVLDRADSAEVYDYVEEAGAAASYGAIGFGELCGRHEGLEQFMQGAQLTADGEKWTREGTENANVRVYSESGEELTLSAQFTNEAGAARYFCLDLKANGGSWEIAKVYEYDMAANTTLLYDSERDQNNYFDWDVFESVFAGIWTGDSGTVELSYSYTQLPWARMDSAEKVDGGWMITGFSGGCGQFLYISENDPDTLYYSELWNNEQTWSEYQYCYHRAQILPEYRGSETCLVYGIQGVPYRRSLAGFIAVREYLSGLEGFNEAMEAAYVDFTDESGTEWSTDIPSGYLPIGYPDEHYYAITLTKQRVELGLPFIIKGSFDENSYDFDNFSDEDLKITDFVLVFENINGEWKHTETRRDARCDFLQQNENAQNVALESDGARLSYKVYSTRDGYAEISTPKLEAVGGTARIDIGEEVMLGRCVLESAPQLEVFPLNGVTVAAVTYRENGEQRVMFFAFNDEIMNALEDGLYNVISSDSEIIADPAARTISLTLADGQQDTFFVAYDEHYEMFTKYLYEPF